MYGRIGSMSAAPGRRNDPIALLTGAVSDMPGCLSYVVAKDANQENAVWITEVWDSKESHDASLSSPSVTKAISAGPLPANPEARKPARALVSAVFENLQDMNVDELVEEFGVTREQVRAVLAFAAHSAEAPAPRP